MDAAEARESDTEAAVDARAELLRLELARARLRTVAAGARVRLLLLDEHADLETLAEAAEATSLEVAKVAGFARMLLAATR